MTGVVEVRDDKSVCGGVFDQIYGTGVLLDIPEMRVVQAEPHYSRLPLFIQSISHGHLW